MTRGREGAWLVGDGPSEAYGVGWAGWGTTCSWSCDNHDSNSISGIDFSTDRGTDKALEDHVPSRKGGQQQQPTQLRPAKLSTPHPVPRSCAHTAGGPSERTRQLEPRLATLLEPFKHLCELLALLHHR